MRFSRTLSYKHLAAVVAAVVVVGAIAIYIATKPTALRPSAAPQAPRSVVVSQIHRQFRVPAELGTVTYQMNEDNSILFYSSAYEGLAPACHGRYVAELQLSDYVTDPQADIDISANTQYRYAHALIRSRSPCAGGGAPEQAVYAAARAMFQSSSPS